MCDLFKVKNKILPSRVSQNIFFSKVIPDISCPDVPSPIRQKWFSPFHTFSCQPLFNGA